MSDPALKKTAIAALAALSTVAAYKYIRTGGGKKNKKKVFLLAGDVGGTNTRLALYHPGSDKPIYTRNYLNGQYITDGGKTFEVEIIEPFLSEWYRTFSASQKSSAAIETAIDIFACFAVAGPVANNCATMTNLGNDPTSPHPQTLSILFDGTAIRTSSHGALSSIVTARIVNDFVGQGYGVLTLDHDTEVVPLTPGAVVDPTGPKVCVGAGTGLGECYLTAGGGGYTCWASEGGHVDYTPRTELQYRLLRYLRERYGQEHRVSVERVVSGRGVADVYAFLAEVYPERVNGGVHEEFLGAGDMQGKTVGENANSGNCGLCREAMEIMMEAYGAEVGNCAVTFLPTGGLYVTGGLTPKNIKFIAGEEGEGGERDTVFKKAYWDKGRVAGVLEKVPLFAVMVEDMGLRGSRVLAARMYDEYISNT